MRWSIPLTLTTVGDDEAAAAAAIVRSGWLTQGEQVAAFEAEFQHALGVPHAIAVSSCTLALELAYEALGVTDGDEIIAPSLTFVSTVGSARRLGATPVFADLQSAAHPHVSAEDIVRRLTPRTRVVTVMHYGGAPVDVPGLRAALDAAGATHVPILEDCAHAPGGALGDVSCGGLGTVGAFSFYGNKNMTTGEGGMLTTRDDALAERLRALRAHGLTTTTWERHKREALTYDILRGGTNAKMDEIRAAIGRVQLSRLATNNRRRGDVVALYHAGLAARPALRETLQLLHEPREGRSAHHLFVVLLAPGTDRAAVMSAMAAQRIQTSVHYPPVHQLTAYADVPSAGLPHTDAIGPRLLTLPLSPQMTEAQVEEVLTALEATLGTTRATT
jgi:dTDP-4-amino-4,6-dideoxygalactose transaminase